MRKAEILSILGHGLIKPLLLGTEALSSCAILVVRSIVLSYVFVLGSRRLPVLAFSCVEGCGKTHVSSELQRQW
jgi:hypothetical protein